MLASGGRPVWRWVVTAMRTTVDAIAWICGLLIAFLVARDLTGTIVTPHHLAATFGAIWFVCAVCGAMAGLYQVRYQHGSVEELRRVLAAVTAAAVCLEVAGLLWLPTVADRPEIICGAALFTALAMISARHVAATARLRNRPPASSAVKIIIFGAGSAGSQLVHRLVGQPGTQYQPVGLLDDEPAKQRLRIRGVAVLGQREDMARVAAETGATVLVIAIATGPGSVIRDLVRLAQECGLTPKVIPSVRELLTGGAQIDGVRDPRITDLLGRLPVSIDIGAVTRWFAGKRILVTGAGGSIGSELCRQLNRFDPAALILLDHDESALHAVQLVLDGRALLESDDIVLADIRDPAAVRQAFKRARPDIVFHAAALKHLPLLERHPAEALKTNVWGTLTVLDAAAACGAQAFVNISTDKAANPVSVLGQSKRITERLTSHMAAREPGSYLSVRFGNVLGSRGSLLTTLSAQIARGGPVTVTHPEVSRYFMTATEAVQLVLQAVAVGRSGEVLVLDMGEPVLIADLARRLVAAASRSIEIVFTGLRPGEKLTEDLLGTGEPDHRPSHPLVRQVPVPPLGPDLVMGIDPALRPQELRAVLADCATGGLDLLAAAGTRAP
jgi:FlaA1/EpsC-like NDP-sugar epimerase